MGSVIAPAKADAPLRVDPDAVLTHTISSKCLKAVASQAGQVPQGIRVVKHCQATCRLICKRLEACHANALKESARISVLEALNHEKP